MNEAKVPRAVAEVRDWKKKAQSEMDRMSVTEALDHVHKVAQDTARARGLDLPTLKPSSR